MTNKKRIQQKLLDDIQVFRERPEKLYSNNTLIFSKQIFR